MHPFLYLYVGPLSELFLPVRLLREADPDSAGQPPLRGGGGGCQSLQVDAGLAQASTELHEVRADILKWMFGFWAPTALAVVGTGLGVLSLLLRR